MTLLPPTASCLSQPQTGTVSETAASTAAQCLQTAGVGTAPIWGSCGGTATLQSAYNAGNTITTTDGRNIAFTFADTATDQSLTLTQQGTAPALIFDDTNGATNTALEIKSGGVSKLTITELGTISTSGNISTTGSGTITSAGVFSGPTATNTINGLIINSGALSGITTIGLSGQLTSTLATGTAPFVVASTTNVANLNASSLNGATFAAPGPIGSGTASTGAFTTLTSSGASTIATGVSLTNTFGSGASSVNTIGSITTPGALTLHGATTLDNTFNTGAITITGAATDITTGTGEDLTLLANGAGVLKLGDFATANGVLFISATDGTVSETAASTAAQCLQTAGVGTAPIWGACGGGGATLQTAYDASSGNTILTTTGRNIAFTLGEVATPTSFTIENQDTAGTSAERIFNSIAGATTLTNGLLVEQTGTGTMTNGIQIVETAGTITTAINIGNNVGTGLSIGTGVTTGISVGSGGVIISAGALAVNSGSITSSSATLVINAGGTVDIQDTANADSLTTDTGGVSIASGQSYTGAGAVTLDSASGTALNVGTGANAHNVTVGNTTTYQRPDSSSWLWQRQPSFYGQYRDWDFGYNRHAIGLRHKD